MTTAPGEGSGERLAAHERERLREFVGAPPRRLLERTVEEVELEVAFEDLVILMVEAGASALTGFLDLAVEIPTATTDTAAKRGE